MLLLLLTECDALLCRKVYPPLTVFSPQTGAAWLEGDHCIECL